MIALIIKRLLFSSIILEEYYLYTIRTIISVEYNRIISSLKAIVHFMQFESLYTSELTFLYAH